MIDKTDGRSLRSGFLRSAAARPDAPALVVKGATRSFRELELAARVWARAILQGSRGPVERVGVFAYRSEASYTGALAALFSGAAFVPLNPTFPVERTRAMARSADLDAIIVDGTAAPQLERVLAGGDGNPPLIVAPEAEAPPPPVLGPSLARPDLASLGPVDPLPPVLPDEVAYLLFTSGSTGQPKGVPVTHANVLHFIDVMAERYGIAPGDRFSQTFDQTFDLSVFDLFVAWERAACVCVPQPIDLLAPARFVARHGITVWFSVPSIAALMRRKGLLKPGALPSLRWSLFCGEPLPQASAEAWQAAAPNSVVENLYGPTELTIACFVHRWDPRDSPTRCVNGVVPIGRPYPGLGALVLDEELRPTPAGAPGELYVCGPQVVPGYWRAPDKTAERFVPLPVPAPERQRQRRFYRTGDRVARLPGGEYAYLGRADDQIKVLGYRVELGEIEAALRRDPRVVEAAAVGWPVEQQGTALGIVAFVCGTEIEPARLKESVRSVLPGYMAPRDVIVVDAMPLNVNGKIDRGALSRRLDDLRSDAAAADAPPPL